MERPDPTGAEPVGGEGRPRRLRLSRAGLGGAAILWVASLAPSLAYALGSPGAHGAWSSADTSRLQDALN